VVKVQRSDGKVTLTQERFAVHFPNPPPLQWKIPLTYAVVGQAPVSLLMTGKMDHLQDIPSDKALKLNVEGTGNYRVQYDEKSWNLLLASLGALKMEDRVNLLCDSWALVQADRAKLSLYLGLIDKLPPENKLAEREQIINVFAFVDRLLAGQPAREKFRTYARSVLRPSFDKLGWDPTPGESPNDGNLRASLIAALGDLNESDIVTGCQERFEEYLKNPASLPPNLRPAVFGVVGHYADEATWNNLHELGLKTTSIEEKQNYYDALAGVFDPKLAQKTLAISLTDELPTSRAIAIVAKVARDGGHADMAWQFAKANMKVLLKKTDALGANSYAPGLFTFFSDKARAEELKVYAKANLPADSAKDVAKAVDEVEFRAEFKSRLAKQFGDWIDKRVDRRNSPAF
jgi:aminopeptidase N